MRSERKEHQTPTAAACDTGKGRRPPGACLCLYRGFLRALAAPRDFETLNDATPVRFSDALARKPDPPAPPLLPLCVAEETARALYRTPA
jgi:hypothetical protein